MKLPTTHSGTTGDCNRHSSDATARQPPSVKAALSVSFGQCAPHHASTRDSSPVCCTVPPPSHGRSGNDDLRRSPSSRSQSREYPVRDRDRDGSMIQIDTGNMTGIEIWTGTDSGIKDLERDRVRSYNYYDRRSKHAERESRQDSDKNNREVSRYCRSRSRSRSRSESQSLQAGIARFDHQSSPQKDGSKG